MASSLAADDTADASGNKPKTQSPGQAEARIDYNNECIAEGLRFAPRIREIETMSTSTDHLTALDSRGERRFYPRSNPSRPIYIPFGANNLCMLLNLSENGFLISTPVGLERNSVYRVSIRLNGVPNPIEVPVRTIWATESRERAGIQILDLSDHDREQIRKWQALESTREKPADPIATKIAIEEEVLQEARAQQKVAPPSVPVIGNGDVKDVAAYQRMKAETGCDGVMIGRGAMGNPWLFQTLVALEKGEPDPGPPSLAERRRVWRRHADLVGEHSPEKMRVHELRKTLAWYSRGLYGGSHLRQRTFTTTDPAALLEMGEAFFAGLDASAARSDAVIETPPDDPITKSIARNGRRGGPIALEDGAV